MDHDFESTTAGLVRYSDARGCAISAPGKARRPELLPLLSSEHRVCVPTSAAAAHVSLYAVGVPLAAKRLPFRVLSGENIWTRNGP